MSEKEDGTVADEVLLNIIYVIRGNKVMLDKDLAELYDVKAIRLREQVKRNLIRFPENFMFQLTEEEVDDLILKQIIISKKQMGDTLPFAFSEHGIFMLSNVLKSDKAIRISIRIIEIFVKLREAILLHKDASLIIEQVDTKLAQQDEKIDVLFTYLNKFIAQESQQRAAIGYKIGK